jgi:hypothetical protein
MNTKWINIFHVANLKKEKKNAEQTGTQSKVQENGAEKVCIRQELYIQSNIKTNCILIGALGC